MTVLEKEAFGPEGDSSRHLSHAALDEGLSALPVAPKDVGKVALIVRRRPDGERETPNSVQLSPEQGIPGDGWSRRPPREPAAELAVMRRDVAELISNGQSSTVCGDNLFVEMDISTGNLAIGARLRVGEAVVEVTPKPHNGCLKFKQRFGQAALEFVNRESTRDQNLRGIYWKVVEAGEVSVGASIVAVPSEP
jgi:hypothetical protein